MMSLNEAKIKEFFVFMAKRESIRRKRLEGNQWPWTEDEILQKYKFTNVKREHDRCSAELYAQVYYPNDDAPRKQILLNCAIARYFGTWEFAVGLGWQEDFCPERIKACVAERKAAKQRVFTGAYIVPSLGKKMPKVDVVVDIVLAGLWERIDELVEIVEQTGSWQKLSLKMYRIDGFGGTGFMAKETILDTLYFETFWPGEGWAPDDFNTWCPAGPGAQRGIRRIMCDENYPRRVKPAAALQYMLELFHSDACARWQEVNRMELVLHDIQFQLCEFDKYERVRLDQGRPRGRYILSNYSRGSK